MVAQPPGNISGEATTQSGNIFNEAMRHEGRELAYREFDKLTHVHQGEVVPHKRLGAMLQMISDQRDEKRSLKGPTRRYPAPARLS